MFFKEQLLSSSQYNVEKTSNKLFAWGLNTSGQVGTVLYIYSLAQLSAGGSHTIALTSDNRILAWGLNSSGQLGTNDVINRSFPVQIGSTGWKKVSAGSSFTVAVRGDGALFTWGANASGQLGDNSAIPKSSPVQISTGISWLNAVAGTDYALATNNNYSLYAWGLNSSGQFGNNLTITRSSPVLITWNPALIDGSTNNLNLTLVLNAAVNTSIVPFSNVPATLANNGISVALNLNTTLAGAAPDQITTASVAAFNVGAQTNYTVECWIYIIALNNPQIYSIGTGGSVAWQNFGINSSGTVYWQFGAGGWGWNGSIASATGAVVINTWYHLAFVKQGTACVIYRNGTSIASGNLTIIAGQGGTLFIGSYFGNYNGDNSYLRGYISNFRMVSGTAVYTSGPFTPPTSPLTAITNTAILLTNTTEETLPSFTQLSAGNASSYGIDTLGRLYAWGLNNAGQLGINTTVNRQFPFQIGTSSFNTISAGNSHAAAIRIDGVLFAWGLNNAGQLGITNTINRSSPVAVGAISFKAVSAGNSFTLAIGTDNLLYTWGLNNNGQIGVVTATVSRSAPVQVTTGSWDLISAGGLFSVATNNNKLLYSWGNGTGGTQADGSTINRSSPVLVSFSQTISQSSPIQIGADSWAFISSGNNFFIARRSDNLLYGWGLNSTGQLGDNTTITKSSPVQIGTSSWTAVAASEGNFSHAIRSDGTLWTWGDNTFGIGFRFVATSWQQVSKGPVHVLAIRSDGSLWAWGGNAFGMLGNNSVVGRSSPIQVGSLSNWTMVGVGTNQFSSALNSLGEFYVWGNNGSGDLGLGDTISRSSPTLLPSNTGSWVFAAGSGGITNDGKLWRWGLNNFGSIGDNSTIGKSSPVHVAVGTSFTFVIAYQSRTFAIDNLSQLWAWGGNSNGSLGTNDVISRSNPVQITNPSVSWMMVATSTDNTVSPHSLGITTTGALYSWGSNNIGQLGLGDTINRSIPTQIGTSSWASVGAASSLSVAIDSTGKIFAWGSDNASRLGDGLTVNRSSPIQITGSVSAYSTNSWRILSVNNNSTGYVHAIRDDGIIFAWGENAEGQLGDNTIVAKTTVTRITAAVLAISSPMQVGSGSNWSQINSGLSAQAAITSTGELFFWGTNTNGQLGTGDTLSRNLPYKIDNNSWNSVSVGYTHTAAVRSDNRLYVWGGNANFQIGDDTSINRSSPVQIGVGSSYIAASAGNNHTLAIRSDNILFAWGLNNAGQLGIVTEAYSWTQIGQGYSHALAIRSDGTLWAWGSNTQGQLGVNDTLAKSSPVQVGTSSWIQISSNNLTVLGIRTDGALFAWGWQGLLQLGDGFAITRSSPVQIGTSSWSQISVGTSHTLAIAANGGLFGWGIATALNASTAPFSWTVVSENTSHTMGVRSDGLLFGWGLNTSGQLGIGDALNRSSPTQIGASSWLTVSSGQNHTLGVTADYRLFAWGNNAQYQLGDNSTIARSSPIQIGIGLSWSQVDAANSFSMAITTNNNLYVWGLGGSGQLGSLTEAYSWNSMSAGSSTSLAIRSNNRLYGWGLNTSGQLGDNTTITKSSPVQVAGTLSWSAVSTGVNHTLAITNIGELYGWGDPTSGATGNYGEIYSWNIVSGSGANWYGIRSDGSLWVSGTNSLGQLGLNDTLVRSSPTQVGTSSWLFVNSGGGTNGNAVFGITTDNRLFAWGNNGNGQLGLNDLITRSSPTFVGNSYSFVTTGAQTLAIRTDGTLWATGVNTTGQLGTNDVISRSNFVQVGTSSWTKVAAADGHTLAIRSDSTLWTWGTAGTNQLGINSTINRSSPVQVTSPGASPWIDIAGGFLYSVGITGAGLGTPYSAYVWGGNNNGATGLNTTVGNNALPTLMKAGAAGNSFVQVTTNWGGGSQPNTFIRSNNGQIWSMGHFLLIGDGVFGVSRSSPVLVAGSTSWSQLPVTAQVDGVMCAIATNNTLWGWDLVPSYLTYAGSGVTRVSAPVQVGGNIRWGSYTFPLYSILSDAGQGSWTSVAAGNSFSFGIKNNLLYGWGQNTLGQTGTNLTSTPILSPTQIGSSSWSVVSASELGNFAGGINSSGELYMWGSGPVQTALYYNVSNYSWAQLSSGWSHTVGIKSDGSLWTWGDNTFGQLGHTDTVFRSSPTQVGISSWLFVSAGIYQTFAIRTDGTLWSWGYNYFGNLGLNITSGDRSSPTQIGTNSWAMISANGYYSAYGILSNGQLYAWGWNDFGQLGQLNVINRSSPTLITSSVSWRQVSSAGRFVAAIKTDDTLWTWGLVQSGVSGDGTTINKSSPTQVPGSWLQVSATGYYTAGLNAIAGIKFGGTLWGWGVGAYIGQNSVISRSSPVQIGTSTFTQITTAGLGFLAMDTSNRLFTWGNNDSGALGLGDTINRSSPTLLAAPSGTSWRLLSLTSNNGPVPNINQAVDSTGNLWIWGNNSYWGLGQNDTINRSSPVQLAGNWVQTSPLYSNTFLLPVLPQYTSSPVQIGTSSWTQLSTGASHSLAIRADSTLWGWGLNSNYQLGLGGTDNLTRSSPIQIGNSSWSAVAAGFDHSIAIRNDGTLWGWGNNAQGQIGVYTDTYSWIQVECRNSSTLAIRTDYTLWVWGLNGNGQLGLGDVINRSSPVQVPGSWQSIGVNTYHAGGIRTDGTLWMWGYNDYGQLGTNNTLSTSSPVQVFGGGSWTQISLGLWFTLGINSSGQGFAWGLGGSGGAFGWLGNGTSINRSNPTQISGGYSWTQLAANIGRSSQQHQSFGIRTDNILMTWGSGQDGMSGGAGSPLLNPTLIPGYTTTTWRAIYPGYLTVFAITSAGGLLVWGSNSNNVAGTGQSGGAFGQYNTPTGVAIVGATNRVEANESHAIALQSDGTLWGWGIGVAAVLLSASNVSRSSPTQISSSSWSQIRTGLNSAFAIQNNKIYSWGASSSGQGGTGYLDSRSSPTQVGDNPNINTLSPVQIGNSSWSQVSAGTQYTLAKDINDNIYAWGQDSSGQLGL